MFLLCLLACHLGFQRRFHLAVQTPSLEACCSFAAIPGASTGSEFAILLLTQRLARAATSSRSRAAQKEWRWNTRQETHFRRGCVRGARPHLHRDFASKRAHQARHGQCLSPDAHLSFRLVEAVPSQRPRRRGRYPHGDGREIVGAQVSTDSRVHCERSENTSPPFTPQPSPHLRQTQASAAASPNAPLPSVQLRESRISTTHPYVYL